MRIANPIYDVVFKYLMEDRESTAGGEKKFALTVPVL
jgi:hypothetical protein